MSNFSNYKINPTSIRLESTTFCQLKCPSCPTANGTIKKTLGSQHLNFKIFESLLEDNPLVKHIELSNWGELFLNPQLLSMLELAFKKGVQLTANNGSNLNYIKPEVIEGLVKYKFKHITCSIDGLSQAAYEIYRRKGNIENVFKNIHEINRFKKELNIDYPKLEWQFIIFKHNFHEIPAAKLLAKKLNMQMKFKLSWDNDLAPDPKHSEWIFNETGLKAVSRMEFKKKTNTNYIQKEICLDMWKSPQLNSDGKVLGCAVNKWGNYGNYKSGSLENIFNGERMLYARKMIMGKVKDRKEIPCSSCYHYKAMKKEEDWITKEHIGFASKTSSILEIGLKIKNKLKVIFN